jgi:hypothetical protein
MLNPKDFKEFFTRWVQDISESLKGKTVAIDGKTLRRSCDKSDHKSAIHMVIASLAWDLKAWYGMLMPYRHLGFQIMRMEFKRFINMFIRIPCLIIKTGRRIYYRIVGYNNKVKHALNLFTLLKTFAFK